MLNTQERNAYLLARERAETESLRRVVALTEAQLCRYHRPPMFLVRKLNRWRDQLRHRDHDAAVGALSRVD